MNGAPEVVVGLCVGHPPSQREPSRFFNNSLKAVMVVTKVSANTAFVIGSICLARTPLIRFSNEESVVIETVEPRTLLT